MRAIESVLESALEFPSRQSTTYSILSLCRIQYLHVNVVYPELLTMLKLSALT
jgi:hypothetical protein